MSQNIDFTTLVQYKSTSRVDISDSGAAWNANYPSGWEHTISTVANGIYELEVRTSFLGWEKTMEFDFSAGLVSGFTQIAHADSTATGNVPGLGRVVSVLAKATGTSGKYRAVVRLGGANQAVSVYDGYMIARRIG